MIETVKEYERRLEEFPFGDVDPAVAAAQGRERFENAVNNFQAELDRDIKAFIENLTRLSDDILTEGKLQWSFLERWPSLALGVVSAIAGTALLVWPNSALTIRGLII